MKTWIKGGLWGAVVGIVSLLLQPGIIIGHTWFTLPFEIFSIMLFFIFMVFVIILPKSNSFNCDIPVGGGCEVQGIFSIIIYVLIFCIVGIIIGSVFGKRK